MLIFFFEFSKAPISPVVSNSSSFGCKDRVSNNSGQEFIFLHNKVTGDLWLLVLG